MKKDNIKKIIMFLIGLELIVCSNSVYAIENSLLSNIDFSVKKLSEKSYPQKTVRKHYIPYLASITNNNGQPLLLSTNTELELVSDDGESIISENRRSLYRSSRKRDMGRYYTVTMPTSVMAWAIVGLTFGIAIPAAAVIHFVGEIPANKAVKTNVGIAQDLYSDKQLPIRFEPNKSYDVLFLLPKAKNIKGLKITNVTFDNETMFDMIIPLEEGL